MAEYGNGRRTCPAIGGSGRLCFFLPVFPVLLLSGCLSGCLSLVETAGRVLDGAAFEEKTLARYRTERGGPFPAVEIRELRHRKTGPALVVILKDFPALELRLVPAEGGGFRYRSLRYLGSSVSGWNEFTLDLSGTAAFSAGAGGGRFSGPGPEAGPISAGKIRRGDRRITEDEALTVLRNRHERILALVKWMKEEAPGRNFADRKEFVNYWKPILLPEKVPRRRRPPGWRQAAREDARWVRAEGVRWNAAYTEALFPESLRPLRDSGALLRDWEEAFEWIYHEFAWDRIGKGLGEITLKKIK
ncbi:MAG: hypothetical protein LBS06_03645 [Treponema sp.]|jgi:hypothetical protein|nr:hypothetical protein [Treponema sp.]